MGSLFLNLCDHCTACSTVPIPLVSYTYSIYFRKVKNSYNVINTTFERKTVSMFLPVSLNIRFSAQKNRHFQVHTINRPWAGYRPPPRGNFVHYDFLKLHYLRHKIKYVSSLRVAALTSNIKLYTLPPQIALNVPDNVSTMTCSYIYACCDRFMIFVWHIYIF